jgi:hypothetical protein
MDFVPFLPFSPKILRKMEQEAQKMCCFMDFSKKIVAIQCIIFDIKGHFFAPFYKKVALKCSLMVKKC